jgi:hypothetical protein
MYMEWKQCKYLRITLDHKETRIKVPNPLRQEKQDEKE